MINTEAIETDKCRNILKSETELNDNEIKHRFRLYNYIKIVIEIIP